VPIVVFVHRWLGVALCLLFLVWFASGIGMMYWDFPAVTDRDRLARSPALDRSAIVLSPHQAYATLRLAAPPDEARLGTFDGRPVYRFRADRAEHVIYADTGELRGEASAASMRRAAARWSGQREQDAAGESIDEVDQWTVQGPLRTMRPLWKYSWPDGQQVYVAQSTGEVVQYTTRASRLGAYLGPIPHWLYFTPLRNRPPQWTAVVVWSSGLGTIAAVLGLAIGVWRYSPSKRYVFAGARTGVPYRGQKRWHMILGLIFGVGAATWAFSGMLSMDPFPSLTDDADRRRAAAVIEVALRGPIDLAAFDRKAPRSALAELAGLPIKELELTTFDARPVYLASLDRGETRVVPVDGAPRPAFDRDRIARIVADAVRPAAARSRLLDAYDAYYLDRHGERPLPVLRVDVDDADRSRYYIDPRTARVAGTYSSRAWTTRWLYHGLHSLDFPWLYAHRPAWDVVVVTFMLGGTALSVTSLVLASQVVGAWRRRSGRQ
jgi:PepSY-associated TM region